MKAMGLAVVQELSWPNIPITPMICPADETGPCVTEPNSY